MNEAQAIKNIQQWTFVFDENKNLKSIHHRNVIFHKNFVNKPISEQENNLLNKSIEYLYQNYFLTIQNQLNYSEKMPIDMKRNFLEESKGKYKGSFIEQFASEIFFDLIYKKISQFDSKKGEFGGWVRTCVHHFAVNYYKQSNRVINQEDPEVNEIPDDLNEPGSKGNNPSINEILKKEIQDCVRKAYQLFCKKFSLEAEALQNWSNDISIKDIAKRLNLKTYAYTKVFISNAKKRFKHFTKDCYELIKS